MSDADVRAQIYESLLTTGRAPLIDDRDALRRLADEHILVLDADGEIVMAPPFSAVPTPFVVRSDDVQSWGNCIWDALGILVMMKRDGIVETACGCCGSPMTLHVEGGELVEREGLVHYLVCAKDFWSDIVFT
jgi:hypothetical protein